MKKVGEIALLLSMSVAIFLVVSEVGLRFYLQRNISFDVEMGRYARLLEIPSENPLIRHRQQPGADVQLMGVPVRTNTAGFRDQEMSKAKTEGTWRVLLLGDSLTFGWGVRREQTFARLLETRLDATRETEVLNLGHVNYNTVQQVNLLLDEGLAYHPDQVVVFFFINDAEPVPAPSELSWVGNLRFARFYGSRLKALQARFGEASDYRAHYAAFYREEAPGWRAARDAFAALRDACRENGIALQVVLLPELHELARYPFAREHEQVGAFLQSEGIPFLDLPPLFATEADPPSLWVAPDDAHPNARGHALIAEHAFSFIASP